MIKWKKKHMIHMHDIIWEASSCFMIQWRENPLWNTVNYSTSYFDLCTLKCSHRFTASTVGWWMSHSATSAAQAPIVQKLVSLQPLDPVSLVWNEECSHLCFTVIYYLSFYERVGYTRNFDQLWLSRFLLSGGIPHCNSIMECVWKCLSSRPLLCRWQQCAHSLSSWLLPKWDRRKKQRRLQAMPSWYTRCYTSCCRSPEFLQLCFTP